MPTSSSRVDFFLYPSIRAVRTRDEQKKSYRGIADKNIFGAFLIGRTLIVTFHDTCMGQGKRGKKELGPALGGARFLARRRRPFELQLA